MNVNELLSITRQSKFPKMLPAKQNNLDEKYSNLIANANISLAKLFGGIQMGMERNEILVRYCDAMRDFLEIANFKEWAYIMLISDEDLNALGQKWKSDSLAVVYLSIQQQLNQCYFHRQPQSLVHAWHMFLKLGLIDLDFEINEIEDQFKKQF